MSHLTADLLILALQGHIPLSAVVRQAHAHLLEVCEVCAPEWAGVPEGAAALPDARPVPPDPHLQGDVPPQWRLAQEAILREERQLSRLRQAARIAREDLRRLLRLPMEGWNARVVNARTRYRSRAFAWLVIEEVRERVRSRPREAAALAALVEPTLAWTRHRPDLEWAPELRIRAAAHRANALRIAGDLGAAGAAFRDLRSQWPEGRIRNPVVSAEVDSLEASLAIGMRRFEIAERLLERAVRLYRWACDPDGEARSLTQLGNLTRTLGRPEEALELLSAAADLLADEADPYLFICTVTGRVNALCDLDQAAQADELLKTHAGAYAACEDDFLVHHLGLLRGRIALGLGRLEEAEERFRTARDAYLDLGRDYDAILNALYLADALLAAGKTAELGTLAAELVPLFRARGVARETLAALRLLTQAATAETVSTHLLHEVRKAVEGSRTHS